MGGDKTYCFMKAPAGFAKQVNDVAEIFMYRAHKKLMEKVDKGNGHFDFVFSKAAQAGLEKEYYQRQKEMQDIK